MAVTLSGSTWSNASTIRGPLLPHTCSYTRCMDPHTWPRTIHAFHVRCLLNHQSLHALYMPLGTVCHYRVHTPVLWNNIVYHNYDACTSVWGRKVGQNIEIARVEHLDDQNISGSHLLKPRVVIWSFNSHHTLHVLDGYSSYWLFLIVKSLGYARLGCS